MAKSFANGDTTNKTSAATNTGPTTADNYQKVTTGRRPAEGGH